jgi:thioredoxin-related protein
MNFFAFLIPAVFLISNVIWDTDFERATEKAKQEHKLILLKFSGSDWCIPCIRMQKEIFEDSVFINFADSSLVLVNADFPRLKKNKLSDAQKKKNEKLADRFNPNGDFPLTLLMNENGKVLQRWEGYSKTTAQEFVIQLKRIKDGR